MSYNPAEHEVLTQYLRSIPDISGVRSLDTWSLLTCNKNIYEIALFTYSFKTVLFRLNNETLRLL